jgi:hypothetical protein
MLGVTGAQILTFVGNKAPTPDDITWSDAVAVAVTQGLLIRLNGAVMASPSAGEDELNVALLLAGAEAYKRREAAFGSTGFADLEGSATRLTSDYLEAVKPLIDRYSTGPGIG